MPYNYFQVQSILVGVSALLLLWATVRAFMGASGVRMYERKHGNSVRLATFLLGLGLANCLGFMVVQGMPVSPLLQLEGLGIAGIVIWLLLALAKVKATLIHGKKFAVLTAYSLSGLIALILLELMLHWWLA
jgi:hypothetical protein